MGLMRFLVHDRPSLADEVLRRIFMTGLEEVPWCGRVYWREGQLLIEREECDSGSVHVPWPCGERGELLLSTACLIERERPYLLEVELARGAINALRNQLAAWQQVGLKLPEAIGRQLAEAGRRFAHAATSQHEPAVAAELAQQAIQLAAEADRGLGTAYARQALDARRQHTPKLSTLLAINLGRQSFDATIAKAITSTFNAAVVPMGWRQVEIAEGRRDWNAIDQQLAWCQRAGLKICGGPLLQMDATGLPDWAYLWEGDFENLLSFILEHVRAVATRYKGKVQLWQVAGRVNCGQFLSLTEEQRLRVVVRAIEAVREIDARTPLVVLFDQPWGEYLAAREMDLAPIHFADALARGDLGLSGLGLEINPGYFPHGTLSHGMIDFSRQLDRWSSLGLPLMIALAAPSAGERDPQAILSAQPTEFAPGEPRTPRTQSRWLSDYLPLLLAKNSVQVLCYNQLRDAVPHDLPHGGLFDARDQPKPAVEVLRSLRETYLN